MLKMKSALSIVAIFSLALGSCVKHIPEKEMPNVDNGAITMVKASVKPLTVEGLSETGYYKWDGVLALGIYGTSRGLNECYLPVKSTAGSSEAYFYGNEVAGDLTIYAPYSKEGGEKALEYRVDIPAVQKYYANPLDHMMYNSSFLGITRNNEIEFDYHAGLVKILIKYDIAEVKSVKVLVGNIHEGYSNYIAGELDVLDGLLDAKHNPSDAILINNFGEGVGASIAEPLVVWAIAAPGIYENFVVEITDKNDATISSPVAGPFEVSRTTLASKECVAKKNDHNNGVDDMLPEDGEFNE
jgi:hypothetical protein